MCFSRFLRKKSHVYLIATVQEVPAVLQIINMMERSLGDRPWSTWRIKEKHPYLIYQGPDGKTLLLITGIGSANAAIACTYVVCKHLPGLIINIGYAGLVKGLNLVLGDMVVISEAFNIDHFVPQVLDHYRADVRVSLDGRICDFLFQRLRMVYPNVRICTCGSADMFVSDKMGLVYNELIKNVDVVDMELFEIAVVGKKFSVAVGSVKIVSDSLNEHEYLQSTGETKQE